MLYWLLPLLFLLTLGLTWCYLRVCISNTWYDIPNERSAHKTPVPGGAGLVFSLVYYGAASAFYFSGLVDNLIYILVSLSLIMMIVGLVDDFVGLTIRPRLLAQFVITIILLLTIANLSSLQIPGTDFRLGLFGYLFVMLGIIWLINLVNFMDGMDGLAAGEVLFVCLASLLVLGVHTDSATGLLMISLASVLAGFMMFNFAPAKLFMGDAGSNFLGVLLAVLIFVSVDEGVLNVWTWLILLSVFIADTTYTLFSRMMRGAVWYHAHNSHAYQKLMQRGQSQRRVFFLLMLVNLCWVLPLAVLSTLHAGYGVILVTVAYSPLLFISWKLDAGCEKTVA